MHYRCGLDSKCYWKNNNIWFDKEKVQSSDRGEEGREWEEKLRSNHHDWSCGQSLCACVCVVCKIIFKKHQVCLLSSRKPTRGHCCAQIEDVAIQFIFAEIDLGVFQTTCERYCNKMAEMCLPSLTCGGPLYSHQRSGQFSLRWLICLEESRRN